MDPPRQDWNLYEKRCRGPYLEWLRALTPAAAMALHESFHRLAAKVRPGAAVFQKLEDLRWKRKVELRRRLHAAFSALDRARRG
jgi:hypothetical protein